VIGKKRRFVVFSRRFCWMDHSRTPSIYIKSAESTDVRRSYHRYLSTALVALIIVGLGVFLFYQLSRLCQMVQARRKKLRPEKVSTIFSTLEVNDLQYLHGQARAKHQQSYKALRAELDAMRNMRAHVKHQVGELQQLVDSIATGQAGFPPRWLQNNTGKCKSRPATVPH
jgi:uncharacterized protein HemX